MYRQDFDAQVMALVDAGRLSSSKMKSITQLASQNLQVRLLGTSCGPKSHGLPCAQNDAHLVSTLFRIHKRAKPANKIWSFYVVDAISRDCRSSLKAAAVKGKAASSSKGSAASFLQKMESCLERIFDEIWERGLPEHRVRIRQIMF